MKNPMHPRENILAVVAGHLSYPCAVEFMNGVLEVGKKNGTSDHYIGVIRDIVISNEQKDMLSLGVEMTFQWLRRVRLNERKEYVPVETMPSPINYAGYSMKLELNGATPFPQTRQLKLTSCHPSGQFTLSFGATNIKHVEEIRDYYTEQNPTTV